MSTIHDREIELVDEFALFDDWMDKYEHIIELGKELNDFPATDKTEENRIKGCQSQVWLTATFTDNKVFFKADSDAIITKGLVGLLIRVLSGSSPQEILDCKFEFINQIGLHQHLSPNRSNGFANMVKQVKAYALAYSSKTSN